MYEQGITQRPCLNFPSKRPETVIFISHASMTHAVMTHDQTTARHVTPTATSVLLTSIHVTLCALSYSEFISG